MATNSTVSFIATTSWYKNEKAARIPRAAFSFLYHEVVAMKLTVLFVAISLAASAQTPPAQSDSSVIQALLSEVHQLRLAIERTNSIGPRIQLAVERVRIQQQVVTRLSDQLEAVRNDLEK